MVKRHGTALAAALVALASALVVAACGGGGGDSLTEPRELPFVRINTAAGLVPTPQADHVVRTEAEWTQVWVTYNANRLTLPPQPTVDFTQRMVLGAARGNGPNGCWGMNITRVDEEATRVRVSYVIGKPRPTDICTQALVSLVDFVSVPRVNKAVVFVDMTP